MNCFSTGGTGLLRVLKTFYGPCCMLFYQHYCNNRMWIKSINTITRGNIKWIIAFFAILFKLLFFCLLSVFWTLCYSVSWFKSRTRESLGDTGFDPSENLAWIGKVWTRLAQHAKGRRFECLCWNGRSINCILRSVLDSLANIQCF